MAGIPHKSTHKVMYRWYHSIYFDRFSFIAVFQASRMTMVATALAVLIVVLVLSSSGESGQTLAFDELFETFVNDDEKNYATSLFEVICRCLVDSAKQN